MLHNFTEGTTKPKNVLDVNTLLKKLLSLRFIFFIKQRLEGLEEASHSAVPFSHRQFCCILCVINLLSSNLKPLPEKKSQFLPLCHEIDRNYEFEDEK